MRIGTVGADGIGAAATLPVGDGAAGAQISA